MSFHVKEGSIEEVVALSKTITEFDNPYEAIDYQKKLQRKKHLILVAYAEEVPVGFKVGYDREGYFYSWMGAVHPDWRRKGVAKALANQQETWARQQGYPSITFKTRNRLKAMLTFALSNGFDIIGFEAKEDKGESRIWLRKELS